jgi:hypothetical protein
MEVGHEIPHAPLMVDTSIPWNLLVNYTEYPLVAVQDDVRSIILVIARCMNHTQFSLLKNG